MKTILLVADPGSIATGFRLCLKPQRSLQLLEANSIEHVLDRFLESNGKIALLVIDAAFNPPLSGIDLALNLRRLFPGLKILLTSPDSALRCTPLQKAAVEILPPGTVAFLRRPYFATDLQRRIHDLLAPSLLKAA